MFSKAELEQFLAALLAFVTGAGLSAAMSAKVLGASHQSTCRWLTLARAYAAAQTDSDKPKATVYRYLAEPALRKLNRLNELDESRGLYTAIQREKPSGRVDILLAALDGRAV